MGGMPNAGYYGAPPAGAPYGGMNPAYRGGQPGMRPGGGPRGGMNGGVPVGPGRPNGLGPDARGPPAQARGPQEQQQAPPKLNAASLARAGPGEQKQMLGEAIYPLIFA